MGFYIINIPMSRKKILFCVADIGYEVASQSRDSSTTACPCCLEDLTESAFSLAWDNIGDNICYSKDMGWLSRCIAISAQMLTHVTMATGEMFLPFERNCSGAICFFHLLLAIKRKDKSLREDAWLSTSTCLHRLTFGCCLLRFHLLQEI